jgi:hypothetical protein
VRKSQRVGQQEQEREGKENAPEEGREENRGEGYVLTDAPCKAGVGKSEGVVGVEVKKAAIDE